MISLDLHEYVLKLNSTLQNKYFYTVSSTVLRYIKQDSSIARSITSRQVKKHSRFIMYSEIKQFLKLIGYNNVSNKWFNEQMVNFCASDLVQSSNKEGLTISTKRNLFSSYDTEEKEHVHSIYSNIVLNPNSKRFKTFTMNDFTRYAVNFLYGIPQATFNHKNISSGVQPIGQISISMYLGISQSRVAQITADEKKVYIFTEITEAQKAQCLYFKNEYISTIRNLGVNKAGETKKDKHMKLVGSKLLTQFNYKSVVLSTENGRKEVKKEAKLVNNRKRKEKLQSPKLSSRVDKIGSLNGFKIDKKSMTNANNMGIINEVTMHTVQDYDTILTYQMVATKRDKAVKKLHTEVRLQSMYKDIEEVNYEANDSTFNYKSMSTRKMLLYKGIGKIHFNDSKEAEHLYLNYNYMVRCIHEDVSKYVNHQQMINYIKNDVDYVNEEHNHKNVHKSVKKVHNHKVLTIHPSRSTNTNTTNLIKNDDLTKEETKLQDKI